MTAVTVVPLGCGGGSDSGADERQIRSAMKEFVLALAGEDYKRVCALVTPYAGAEWARFARRNPDYFSTAGCPAFAEDFYGDGGPRRRRKVKSQARAFELTSVRIIWKPPTTRP